MEILIFIGAALAVLLAVIFIRALRFRPYPAAGQPRHFPLSLTATEPLKI
ncbi:MAG: hypothetical protein ACOX21_04240 [Bacillota bacterium]